VKCETGKRRRRVKKLRREERCGMAYEEKVNVNGNACEEV